MVFRQCRRVYYLSSLAYKGINAPSCSQVNRILFQKRLLHTSLRYAAADRSKVEYTLKMLKEDLLRQEEARKRKLVPATSSTEKKATIIQRIVHEFKHYYHGFRLLALETKLSAKYMWRLLRGDTLSRRERQQLVRLFLFSSNRHFIITPVERAKVNQLEGVHSVLMICFRLLRFLAGNWEVLSK
ncbi:hypothetical protein COOONC_25447 [Cooperia oncophora]